MGSRSKGRAERPLPTMVRQAHHDSPFYDVIPPSEFREILLLRLTPHHEIYLKFAKLHSLILRRAN
jgi:hypothetical protein